MYKTIIITLCAAALPAAAADPARSYLRGGLLYVMPDNEAFNDGAGVLVQLGGTIGGVDLGVETGWISLDADVLPAFAISQQYVPALASFRARWPLTRDDSLALNAGLSGGGAWVHTRAGGDSHDAARLAYGGELSLQFRPAGSRLDLSLGYKYIAIEGGSFNVGGVGFSGAAKAHCLFATGGVRF